MLWKTKTTRFFVLLQASLRGLNEEQTQYVCVYMCYFILPVL